MRISDRASVHISRDAIRAATTMPILTRLRGREATLAAQQPAACGSPVFHDLVGASPPGFLIAVRQVSI
jgi:hypothetical protein